MTLRLSDFPRCCTTKILHEFGDSGTTPGESLTEDQIVEQATALINQARADGNAIITATTNDSQQTAVRALNRLGFAHSKWASKTRHPETRVRVWYLRLNRED